MGSKLDWRKFCKDSVDQSVPYLPPSKSEGLVRVDPDLIDSIRCDSDKTVAANVSNGKMLGKACSVHRYALLQSPIDSKSEGQLGLQSNEAGKGGVSSVAALMAGIKAQVAEEIQARQESQAKVSTEDNKKNMAIAVTEEEDDVSEDSFDEFDGLVQKTKKGLPTIGMLRTPRLAAAGVAEAVKAVKARNKKCRRQAKKASAKFYSLFLWMNNKTIYPKKKDNIEILICDYCECGDRTRMSTASYPRHANMTESYIEMIEHVRNEYIEEFFRCCESLLAEGRLFILQFKSMPEELFEEYIRSPGFIKEYIFPGGCLLPLSRVLSAMADASKLSKVLAMGFDEMFMRIWEYYFDYCAAGFKSRTLGDYQVVFARPGNFGALGEPYQGCPSAYSY
ncbi:hypothetical protein PTKIN_Ptkin09bG0037800 [Pterospermum kingtungense]